MTDISLKDQLCPSCGHRVNRVTPLNGNDVKGGDVCLCAYCASILTVNSDQGLSIMTAADLLDLGPVAVLKLATARITLMESPFHKNLAEHARRQQQEEVRQ